MLKTVFRSIVHGRRWKGTSYLYTIFSVSCGQRLIGDGPQEVFRCYIRVVLERRGNYPHHNQTDNFLHLYQSSSPSNTVSLLWHGPVLSLPNNRTFSCSRTTGRTSLLYHMKTICTEMFLSVSVEPPNIIQKSCPICCTSNTRNQEGLNGRRLLHGRTTGALGVGICLLIFDVCHHLKAYYWPVMYPDYVEK